MDIRLLIVALAIATISGCVSTQSAIEESEPCGDDWMPSPLPPIRVGDRLVYHASGMLPNLYLGESDWDLGQEPGLHEYFPPDASLIVDVKDATEGSTRFGESVQIFEIEYTVVVGSDSKRIMVERIREDGYLESVLLDSMKPVMDEYGRLAMDMWGLHNAVWGLGAGLVHGTVPETMTRIHEQDEPMRGMGRLVTLSLEASVVALDDQDCGWRVMSWAQTDGASQMGPRRTVTGLWAEYSAWPVQWGITMGFGNEAVMESKLVSFVPGNGSALPTASEVAPSSKTLPSEPFGQYILDGDWGDWISPQEAVQRARDSLEGLWFRENPDAYMVAGQYNRDPDNPAYGQWRMMLATDSEVRTYLIRIHGPGLLGVTVSPATTDTPPIQHLEGRPPIAIDVMKDTYQEVIGTRPDQLRCQGGVHITNGPACIVGSYEDGTAHPPVSGGSVTIGGLFYNLVEGRFVFAQYHA